MDTPAAAPPPRPTPRRERASMVLFTLFSPRVRRLPQKPPPPELAPSEAFVVERPPRPPLAATWYPAPSRSRGVVVLAHPWVGRGQMYFHRHGRIEALREAGYDAVTFEFSGLGKGRRSRTYLDLDVADVLAAVRQRAPGGSLHVWGVSSGGYWSHVALSRTTGVASAMFEDVSPHLLEWSRRMSPRWTPAFLFFRYAFPDAHRFLDARLHAPHLTTAATAYVSGELDPGVRPADTRILAGAARGECRIIAGAGHLESIRSEPGTIIGLALETFGKADAALNS